MGNVKVGIDIAARLDDKTINDQLNKLENRLADVQSNATKGGFGKKIASEISSAKSEVSQLREEFNDLYASFKSQKLDASQFEKFAASIESSIKDLKQRVTDTEQSITELNKVLGAGKNTGLFEKRLDSLQSKINGFVEQTQKGISALVEFNKLVNNGTDIKVKGDTSELKDEIEGTVSSFTFKNGGVKVPVTLDKSQLSKLKESYDQIVGMLQAYADSSPVDVTMRLFPLNTTKAGAKEVSDAVKNVQTQIASLPEGELKTSMNELYGNLEQQFQKALRLKVSVDLGETQASVKQRIAELQESVKEQGFTIYPNFDISDVDADNITAKLTEIQEKLTLSLTSDLTTMSESMNALFNNTAGIENWSNTFNTALTNIEGKLNAVIPLIDQLKNGITTDSKSTNLKKNVPTEGDVNILIEFINAMKALRESLLSQQTAELNIDVSPLLDKLDNVKATVSMVHTGIGHLQSTLANVKNTGGLQIAVETLQRIETILGEINSKQSALDIKVEPEVDVQSFINQIQEQIGQYEGVKVPISVLESSIDSFIQQIQFAVDSRLTNGDIGTESFLPSADSDLGANQVTALNRRIGSLKEKIESVWESWQQFGQAAISGTNFAKEGVVGVSNKLEELSWALQAISNSFVGIDFSKQIGDLNVLKSLVDINTTAGTSASNISAEARAMEEVYDKALKAAEAKEKFSGANKEVLESIINSLSALNSEGEGFANLNKLINNLARNKDDRITDMVANLELLRDALSSPVDENAFINAIAKLASQGERLSDLATVLKASKTQLQNASSIVDTKELSNVDKAVEQYNRLYNAQIELAKIKPGTNAEKYIYYTQEVNEATLATTNLKLTEEEEAAVAEQTSAKKVQATNALAEAKRKEEELNQKNIESAERLQTSVTKQATTLLSNGKLMSEYGNRIREILEEVNSLNTKADPSSATEKLKAFRSELDNITNSAKQAGNYGQSFSQILNTRFKSLTAYLSTFTSFYKVVSYIRQVISTVQELNTQMIELAKVSDQSIEDIKADFNSYAETAKDLGATISDTISATSDWARMGYNIPDSQELARVALLYKNVGDGIDIAAANESLISTLQGYQMTADEAEHIVDVFNEVSNNFAISSGGIGEALQRSAASLNAANTSLEKSVALVTSANTVLQNPESVGTIFKTLSARIRGAKTDLEELGEEEDEFTQSTSKLQGLVKGLTGFDILEEDGETFKDIYDILIGIGKEWDNLTDVEQASLGEALAGKRNSNALYAILDNLETLEQAYETAENSAGSAMREQENYEKGIEYSINRAKAALEELSNDMVNSDFLKGLIDDGTKGIELLDNIIDKIGILKTVIIGISTAVGSQKLGIFNTKDSSTILGALTQISSSKKDINSYKTVIDDIKSNTDTDWFNNIDISTQYSQMSDNVKTNLQSIQSTLKETGASGQDAIGKINTSIQESSDKASKATSSFKKFGAMAVNALASLAISTAISLAIQGIQNLINSYDLLAKKAQEIATNFQSSKKQIDDYATEIQTLRGVMEDETSTTEEVRDATSKLYSIQSDLIGTYGAYHDGINLVNGDLTTQLEILKQINAENAQQAVNDINYERSSLSTGTNVSENIAQMLGLTAASPFGYGAVELLYGKKVYDNLKSNKGWGESALSALTESDLFGQDKGFKAFGSSVEQITDTWENFEATIKATDDEKINNIIDGFEGLSVVGDEIKIAGEVDDINESIVKLQQKFRELGYENESLGNDLDGVYKQTKDIIDSSSDAYETIKYNDIVNGNNAKLTSYYYALAAKNTDIQTAKTAGETEKVEELEEQYKSLLTTISNDSDIDEKYLDYFLEMYPELQNIISEWVFEVKVIPEIEKSDVSEGLKDFLNNNSTEYIQAEYDRYLAPGYVDNKGYSAYFKELEDAASLAKKDVDSLVESLHETDGYRVSGKNALLYQPTQTSYTGVEDQKISDWGLSKYADQIKNGTIQSTYGNVDMDNRNIIEWNDWNLARFKEALESWGTAYDEHGNMVRSYYEDLKDAYDEGYSSIDTVYGAVDYFKYDGEEHPIAFTPILVTEDDSIFLGSDEVYEYINGVIKQATEDGDLSAEHILEIDSEGIGFKVGNNYVKGIIAGIDNYTGEGGQSIPATTTGKLMHFSGQYGAYSLAQTGEGQGNYVTPTANRLTYDNLYKQEMTTLTEEEEAHNELISKWYEGLSDKSKEYFDSIADTLSQEQIDLTFDMNNTFELDNWLYNLQHEADENPIEIKTKFSDQATALDAMEDAFGGLSTAYETSQTGETVSSGELEDVSSDMGGVTFNTDSIADVNALSNAVEQYNETLMKTAGDTEEAQTAADKLATAYIDQSGVLDELLKDLDNVDEGYKQWVIDQLEAKGITNAAEVVNTRLTEQYKKEATALTNLSKKVAQYRDKFDTIVETHEDFEDTAKTLKDDLTDLLTVYDESGNAVIIPEIDTDFIVNNLDTVYRAIEGDVDALKELRAEAAKEMIANVGVDMNDAQAVAAYNELVNLVSDLDNSEFCINGEMDYSAISAKLEALCKEAGIKASEIDAVLRAASGGTISASTEWEEFELQVPDITTVNYNSDVSNYGKGQSNTTKTTHEVSWKTIKYKMPKKTSFNYSSGASGASYGGSNSGSGSSSGGGSGGDSGSGSDTSTDEETFDWVETAINSLEQELDRLDEAIDDIYDNWETRNQGVTDKIAKLTNEIELQTQAAARYEAEAEKYNDIGDEYIQKIKEGVLDIETLEVETSDDDDSDTLIEKIQNYQTWWEKAQEAHDKVGTLTRELGELYKQVFDNIESQYNDLLDEIEKKTDIIEERITRTEEHGFFVDQAYYEALKSLEEDNFKDLEEERKNLITALNTAVTTGNIEKGSAAWYEMYLKIQDVNKAIEESMTNTVKLNNEIRQLSWDKFDWIEERMDDFAEEADFLIKLLQGEETIDDRGYFNDRGYANAALVGAKYDDALAEAQRYAEAIKEIDKDLATEEGKYDKNLIDRKEKLVGAYRDAIEAAEDEKQAMKSLVEEAMKKHLDYLSKLIDKYKDALSTMKSTYEYAKNINDQTKNISNLEKQLAAYQGDTSEEARKKRQELQNQLDSAQQQLEETQWDKYISETGEMLDNLYDNYETYLNDKLSNVTELMSSMIDMINQGTYTVPGAVTLGMNSIIAQLSGEGSITTAVKDTTISIQTGMDEIRNEYDLTTQKFEDFGNTANGTKDILSAWSNGKYINESTFVSKLDEVKNKFSEVTNGAADTIKNAILSKSKDITVNDDGTVSTTDTYKKDNGGASNGGGGNGTTTTGKEPPSGNTDNSDDFGYIERVRGTWEKWNDQWFYKNPDGTYMHDTWFQDPDDGYWYYFDPFGVMKTDEFVEGYWIGADGKMLPDYFSWQQTDGKWWYGTEDGSKYATGTVWINGQEYTFDDSGWWKGYAKGTPKIPSNQLAWTQEEGSELIYRTTDGALLTPLGKGDMVFTNAMSQRLWDIASGSMPFGFDLDSPNVSANANQNVTANNSITIELPNVQNYDDFKREMKQDTELEKFWQEITIGQMMGNARLKKNKY